jgi:hypothetical protein
MLQRGKERCDLGGLGFESVQDACGFVSGPSSAGDDDVSPVEAHGDDFCIKCVSLVSQIELALPVPSSPGISIRISTGELSVFPTITRRSVKIAARPFSRSRLATNESVMNSDPKLRSLAKPRAWMASYA